jgi:hypothetical protein
MTPIPQIRKEQRIYGTSSDVPSGGSRRAPDMHLPPFVLKILGLKSAG